MRRLPLVLTMGLLISAPAAADSPGGIGVGGRGPSIGGWGSTLGRPAPVPGVEVVPLPEGAGPPRSALRLRAVTYVLTDPKAHAAGLLESVRAGEPALQACHDRALARWRGSIVRGHAAASLHLSPAGAVQHLELRGPGPKQGDLRACLTAVLRDLSYPAPGGRLRLSVSMDLHVSYAHKSG